MCVCYPRNMNGELRAELWKLLNEAKDFDDLFNGIYELVGEDE